MGNLFSFPFFLSFIRGRWTAVAGSEGAVKGGEEIVHFSDCGVGRVKVCVFMVCMGALQKDGRAKVAWENLTLHFLVFRTFRFEQFNVLQEDELPIVTLH